MRSAYRRLLGIGSLGWGLLCVLSSSQAFAQNAGQWNGKGIIVLSGRQIANVEDSPDHAVVFSRYEGGLFNKDGKSFLDKAKCEIISLRDGPGSTGYQTFTEADGSKVIAKFTVTDLKLPEIHGTFEFIAGTGQYKGIIGRGTFEHVFISDKVGVDQFSAEYQLPTPTGQADSKSTQADK